MKRIKEKSRISVLTAIGLALIHAGDWLVKQLVLSVIVMEASKKSK